LPDRVIGNLSESLRVHPLLGHECEQTHQEGIVIKPVRVLMGLGQG